MEKTREMEAIFAGLKWFKKEDGIGYRSPCVQQPHHYQSPNSPTNGPGRSVRDFEEQMASLRKDNFNLKLRLYFIEESIPGLKNQNAQDGAESIMKQLIDSKVELEILRKDVQDKQSLLQEADQFIVQVEALHKEADAKNKAVIEELNQKIQFLEIDREGEVDKLSNGDFVKDLLENSEQTENDKAKEKIRELEGLMTEYEDKVNHLQEQIHKLDEILIQRDQTLGLYEVKIKELTYKNDELTDMMEMKAQENLNVMRHVRCLRITNKDLSEEKESLQKALQEEVEKHVKDLSLFEKVQKELKTYRETLNKMQTTMLLKNSNSSRLLERLQCYEHLLSGLNNERNAAKRENRFFRGVIEKFRKSHCITLDFEINRALSIGDGGAGGIDNDIECLEHCRWPTLSFSNFKDYNQMGQLATQHLAIEAAPQSSSSDISLLPKSSSRLIHFSKSAPDVRSEVSNANENVDNEPKNEDVAEVNSAPNLSSNH